MDEYLRLRKLAAAKRDKAIAEARSEYREAVKRIRELRCRLGGESRNASKTVYKPLAEILPGLLPRDRLFTIDDAYELLKCTDTKRYFHLPSVRQQFTVMHTMGLIRRVQLAGGSRVLWAVPEFTTPATEFGALNIAAVAERILRERGPMTALEIVLHAQARGYRPEADPRTVTQSLRCSMCKRSDRFRYGKDKRWAVVGG